MKKSEKDVHNDLMRFLSDKMGSIKLFRNNVGIGLSIDKKRMIRYGLCEGSGDFVGWKTIEITPEMVGNKIAIFTSVELKKPNKSKTTPKQLLWQQNVINAGGRAIIASRYDDFEMI